jgi:endonuclease G, mitochondrial
MQLQPFQRQPLREAISSAFPNAAKLDMLLYERLDTRLNHVVNVQQPYAEVVAELIKWAEDEGRLPELLSQAYQRNPGNPKFRQFLATYGVEVSARGSIAPAIGPNMTGPDFVWQGPQDDRTLQGLWQPDPELWDVGFLQRGIDQAAAVCRIELGDGSAIGTGFLVASNYLLTNYHVLAPHANADPQQYLPQIVLRFATTTAANGQERYNTLRQLAPNPLHQSSPPEKLDYALLKLEADNSSVHQPIQIKEANLPHRDGRLSVLQHPDGQTMKVSLGRQGGITGVYPETGLVQYVGKTAPGSSGSPCFNEQWEVVAMHHAHVSGAFGVKCEGILLSAIYAEIQGFLT